MTTSERVSQVTKELRQEILLPVDGSEIAYRLVPNKEVGDHPVWCIQLNLAHAAHARIGLEIHDEIIIGRETSNPAVINLVSDEDADALGISRRHALLRPTASKLYIIDLGSTNGIKINGHRIGVNTPYSLTHADHLMLGRLEISLQIIKYPHSSSAPVVHKATSIDDTLKTIASSILTQLTVEDALNQAIEQTWKHVHAAEISIWLVDERNGELFLEAERGIGDESVRRLRLSVVDNMVSEVLRTGNPVSLSRSVSGNQIKVNTGYLVEAALYVPIKLGGIAFGVLFAANQNAGAMFSEAEEKLMTVVAEFTAIAVQNARRYQADHNLRLRQSKILTGLNYTLLRDFKQHINMIIGAAGLIADSPSEDSEQAHHAADIINAANKLNRHLEKISEVVVMGEDFQLQMTSCDLIDIMEDALNDLYELAEQRSIKLQSQVFGEPYTLRGNARYLRRSIFHLVDNAIRYSRPNGRVNIALIFGQADTIIRVQDTGYGIPEDDLPYLFEKYYRGQQSEGLGLGLELVRSTVEAHKGTITVRNHADGGAEFVITLPPMLRNA